uniref:Uncharacterized protein n=1 Tax=Romanomermis culicivorax TaxID=13658 RepID=A0A915JFF7_ROMCU
MNLRYQNLEHDSEFEGKKFYEQIFRLNKNLTFKTRTVPANPLLPAERSLDFKAQSSATITLRDKSRVSAGVRQGKAGMRSAIHNEELLPGDI